MSTVTFASVGKQYVGGAYAVRDLNLDIADGEFLVLIGPSGCGKSTALRMVAGLEAITEGTISIDDRVVNEVDPRRRDIAMVFQNYALYPHMTVFDNIAFPLRSMRLPKDEIAARVRHAATRLDLGDMLDRRPKSMSGGQRQRVAMGRAIVRDPKVFLMDEPLSNLDAKLRTQMRAEIMGLQRELGTTTIYVTHDQLEALTMGTRIAVLRRGVLQQVGDPQQVYEAPANLFVASFLGSPPMNLFTATLSVDGGRPIVITRGQKIELPESVLTTWAELTSYVGREVAVGIRPEHLTDEFDERSHVALNGTVKLVETLGSERLVHLSVDAAPVVTDEVLDVARDTDATAVDTQAHALSATLIARVDVASKLRTGDTARLGVLADRIQFFSLESGRRLA